MNVVKNQFLTIFVHFGASGAEKRSKFFKICQKNVVRTFSKLLNNAFGPESNLVRHKNQSDTCYGFKFENNSNFRKNDPKNDQNTQFR